jgi:hypothetical protein
MMLKSSSLLEQENAKLDILIHEAQGNITIDENRAMALSRDVSIWETMVQPRPTTAIPRERPLDTGSDERREDTALIAVGLPSDDTGALAGDESERGAQRFQFQFEPVGSSTQQNTVHPSRKDAVLRPVAVSRRQPIVRSLQDTESRSLDDQGFADDLLSALRYSPRQMIFFPPQHAKATFLPRQPAELHSATSSQHENVTPLSHRKPGARPTGLPVESGRAAQ